MEPTQQKTRRLAGLDLLGALSPSCVASDRGINLACNHPPEHHKEYERKYCKDETETNLGQQLC